MVCCAGDTLLQCQDLSHDASGNVYVSGRCVGNCTFGSFTLTTAAADPAAASEGWDGPYPAAFAAFIVRVNSIGTVTLQPSLSGRTPPRRGSSLLS